MMAVEEMKQDYEDELEQKLKDAEKEIVRLGLVCHNAVEESYAITARAEKAEAEVERLRALCAARPALGGSEALWEWAGKIDAAGRGEGEE